MGPLWYHRVPTLPGAELTVSGYGIINASGELWRAQRKAGLKFFGSENLDVLIEDVLPEAYQKARAELVELAKTGKLIDLQRFFLDLTTTVVGHMAYDASLFVSTLWKSTN